MGKTDGNSSKMGNSLLLLLFIVWYGCNAGYNVYNSYVKEDFAFPYIIALIQLGVGLVYALPLWVLRLRDFPNLNFYDVWTLLPIVILNAFGHLAAVYAMFEIGGGSFTHVIKASEPVVSVILGLIVNQIIPKPLTALSLLPITYGVAYASTLGNLNIATMSKELTTKAAMFAMISNLAFALRSILRKNLTSEFKKRTKLDAANDHAVTTILSLVVLLPAGYLLMNPADMLQGYEKIENKNVFLFNVFACGMCYYLYNEMQNIVLSSLGPVPTAVGNTLKRVVIFVALYYCTTGETFPIPKIVGCAIAVGGCLFFAVFDSMKI